MAIHTFKVTVTGKGKLWSVKFYPENDQDFSLGFSKSPDFKTWKSDEFSIDVEGDFDYQLIVGGPRNTGFELGIEIKNENDWKDLVEEKEGKISEGCTGGSKNKGCIVDSVSIPSDVQPETPIT
ncbi:MAG: hypothetical protein R8N23_10620 [Reichenbachiella sp.]|uniref:hypothetical protein n=1 Tax=Reichenbachiella sp. TaxID=2184521 RepID=UPI0029667B2E|nr:hypothetical protein [Reichenbachiella sp.]MDW3210312.1 hypothetical protein [Reichenbachiella sp.]